MDRGTGCYQLTDSAAKDKTLPARFALDLDRADPSAHIIRAVSADGVADTIIARASWQRSSDNIIDVRFPSVGKVLSLVIQIPAGSATGVAAITGDGKLGADDAEHRAVIRGRQFRLRHI